MALNLANYAVFLRTFKALLGHPNFSICIDFFSLDASFDKEPFISSHGSFVIRILFIDSDAVPLLFIFCKPPILRKQVARVGGSLLTELPKSEELICGQTHL